MPTNSDITNKPLLMAMTIDESTPNIPESGGVGGFGGFGGSIGPPSLNATIVCSMHPKVELQTLIVMFPVLVGL